MALICDNTIHVLKLFFKVSIFKIKIGKKFGKHKSMLISRNQCKKIQRKKYKSLIKNCHRLFFPASFPRQSFYNIASSFTSTQPRTLYIIHLSEMIRDICNYPSRRTSFAKQGSKQATKELNQPPVIPCRMAHNDPRNRARR